MPRMIAELVLSVLQDADEARGYVAGFAVTDQRIVALGGTSQRSPMVLASSDGRVFEPRSTPCGLGLRDALAVGDSLWVCGEYGQLAVSRDHGGRWQMVEAATEACLFALTLGSDGAIWVVGEGGFAARVLGEQMRRVDVGTTAHLVSVHAVNDDLVMLGGDGLVRRWRDGEVSAVACGATQALTGMAITRKGTWVVIGDGGFVARSPDGTWYSRVEAAGDADLEAIGVLSDGTIVIAGDHGRLLVSSDDARTWRAVEHALGDVHLWAIARFGRGLLIGGDGGLIARLAPADDATWRDRAPLALPRALDDVFAAGPEGFIARGLAAYLALTDDGDDGDDSDGDDDDEDDLDEAFARLAPAGTADDFRAIYGVALAPEAAQLLALAAGRARWSSFAELRLDHRLPPDVGAHNLFELMVRRNQQSYLGTDLVDAFSGVFAIGSQGNGDTYHFEIHSWEGRRQVLHFDHEAPMLSGVIADSLDSLVYLAALVKVGDDHAISQASYAAGLRALYGKVAPTWHFAIDEKDDAFVAHVSERHETEFFFYRARWLCALLKNDGITELADIAGLFDPDLNPVTAAEQLPARFEACAQLIPTALYAMWRAYLFDEPELARYLEIGRQHAARLVRDAARLLDELCAGRNELGTIEDVAAWLAGFRALDLDPRRAGARKLEAEARAWADAARQAEYDAELSRTPVAEWSALAWRSLDDGAAHRALLVRLDETQGAQIAAIDALRDDDDDDRPVHVLQIAETLSPELEAVLIGSLVRDDQLDGVLVAPDDDDEVTAPHDDDADADDADDDEDEEDDEEDDDEDEEDEPDPARVAAALSMTGRGLRLAPHDPDLQFTHAMLLLDAERAGDRSRVGELLALLVKFEASVRINIAVRMAKAGHARFGDAVERVLAEPIPTRIFATSSVSVGAGAQLASFGDVAHELLGELGDVILERAPEQLGRLVPLLPDDAVLLSELAGKAIDAGHREPAVALYDRVLALRVPDDGNERTNYLRALNNACVQAHAARAFDAAVRIADRAQAVAAENPHIYHAAACAYAAAGDPAKALDQVRLAIAHGYEHVAKIETDQDLGPLLDDPELKALFRDWHARREGN